MSEGERKMNTDHVPQRPSFIPGTPEELDSVIAAPENHTVVFENERVRVLRVVIPPGVVENKHTHKNPSVFIINVSSDMHYYNDKGEIVTSSGKRGGRRALLGRAGRRPLARKLRQLRFRRDSHRDKGLIEGGDSARRFYPKCSGDIH